MGLFNHLIPPKGKVWITFDKQTFQEGEAVVGKVSVEAHEYVQSNGIKLEARVFETYQEPVWVTLPNNQRIQEMHRVENVLFSRDVQVTGPSDFGQGPTQTFPFSVGIPPCRATRGGAQTDARLHARRIPCATGLWPARIQPGIQSQPSLRHPYGPRLRTTNARIWDASPRSDASATGRAGPLQVLPGSHEPEFGQLPQLRGTSVNDIPSILRCTGVRAHQDDAPP